jgi:hypothetical protein
LPCFHYTYAKKRKWRTDLYIPKRKLNLIGSNGSVCDTVGIEISYSEHKESRGEKESHCLLGIVIHKMPNNFSAGHGIVRHLRNRQQPDLIQEHPVHTHPHTHCLILHFIVILPRAVLFPKRYHLPFTFIVSHLQISRFSHV